MLNAYQNMNLNLDLNFNLNLKLNKNLNWGSAQYPTSGKFTTIIFAIKL